jgi:polyhydroxyalkanoate synthesis regulator phasin
LDILVILQDELVNSQGLSEEDASAQVNEMFQQLKTANPGRTDQEYADMITAAAQEQQQTGGY